MSQSSTEAEQPQPVADMGLEILRQLQLIRRLLDKSQRLALAPNEKQSTLREDRIVAINDASERLLKLVALTKIPSTEGLESELRQLLDNQASGLDTETAQALAERLFERLLSDPALKSSAKRLRRRAQLVRLAVLCALFIFCVTSALTYWLPRRMPGTWLQHSYNWTLSTALPGYPKAGQLPRTPDSDFFFSTNRQKQPHMVIDLGTPTAVVALELTNRRECCYERPLPLTVWTSQDGASWSEVARRTEPFYIWRPRLNIEPSRYLKLQVENESWLHLYQIRIFGTD